jgi:hypothetical protein
LPDTIVNDPTEEDEAVDFSEDGEARDTSVKAERFFTRWLSSLDSKNEAELEASFESAWDELSLTAEEEDKFVDNFITRATNWDALLDTPHRTRWRASALQNKWASPLWTRCPKVVVWVVSRVLLPRLLA